MIVMSCPLQSSRISYAPKFDIGPVVLPFQLRPVLYWSLCQIIQPTLQECGQLNFFFEKTQRTFAFHCIGQIEFVTTLLGGQTQNGCLEHRGSSYCLVGATKQAIRSRILLQLELSVGIIDEAHQKEDVLHLSPSCSLRFHLHGRPCHLKLILELAKCTRSRKGCSVVQPLRVVCAALNLKFLHAGLMWT